MNLHYIILMNGGNNYMENQKGRIKKEYSQQQLISQQTYIQWDNLFKMVAE